MADSLDPLILDFVEWVAVQPRLYAEVMDVWRTSCPRLTVWEDAVDRGFVVRAIEKGALTVLVTPDGQAFLRHNGRTLQTAQSTASRSAGARP